jgi:CxxC-x17-CxxC domain-containing protein
MKDFKKGGFRKGGGDFGGRPRFGNKFGGGKFGGGKRFGGGFGGRPSFGEKKMYSTTCASCGNTCEVPFRPTGEKPVYCRDCFAKESPAPWRESTKREFPPRRHEGEAQGNTQIAELKAQIDFLQGKVNRILEILQPKSEPKAVKETNEEVPAPVSKKEKTKKAPKKKK